LDSEAQEADDYGFGWDKCRESDCEGIKLPRAEVCLRHASAQERSSYLERVRQLKGGVDLRGTEIDADLLEEVLASRYLEEGYYSWAYADFSYASVSVDKANFEWTRFRGPARFKGTSFSGWAEFSFSRFEDAATFEPDVTGLLRISNARFADGISISWGSVGELQAEDIVSEGLVLMDGLTVHQDATFSQSEFKGRVVIASTSFGGSAEFSGTTWYWPTDEKYSVEVNDWLVLDGSEFVKPAHWSVRASVVSMVGANFRDAASFSVEGSELIIDRANFERSARIAGEAFKDPFRSASLIRKEMIARVNAEDEHIPGAPVPEADRGMEMLHRRDDNEPSSIDPIALEERPQIVSARRVALGSMGLTDVDVARCLLFDASRVDELRLTNTSWAANPRGRTKRRVAAEEVHLRAARRLPWGWNSAAADSPAWLKDPRLRPIGRQSSSRQSIRLPRI
jgi:hypothetical protein